MGVQSQLQEDLKRAMKTQDRTMLEVVRLLHASLKNKEIEKKGKSGAYALTEEEVVAVLRSELKKRRESADAFTKGARLDLAKKEEDEAKIIETYLPGQMAADEIEQVVRGILTQQGIQEFGAAMKAVVQQLKGKADGKLVSEIVKKVLGA